MRVLNIHVPLAGIRGIGPRFINKLQRLGLETVGDLLWHFPFRYEDFSKIYTIEELVPGQQATIQGFVENVSIRTSYRRRMVVVEASLRDDTGVIRAVWFNQPYLKNSLREGVRANFAGKVAVSNGDIYLAHPDHEIVGATQKKQSELRNTGRLVPIYPETRGLTSKGIRFLVQPLLANLDRLEEWIPADILKKEGLPELNTALAHIHFPPTIEHALIAKRRFEFENLFLLQLVTLQQKNALTRAAAPSIPADPKTIASLLEGLPFELTQSQKISLGDIANDLARGYPMNRLLQGDVGSGKTVVAALAAYLAQLKGHQTAFMAPTEVLARQHFDTLKKLLLRYKKPPTVGLLMATGAETFYGDGLETTAGKSEVKKLIASGDLSVVVGTHALIQKDISFRSLGLVIVDEQHRFGVKQRAVLVGAKDKKIPHFLSMSATPIPRTLMLSVFGDLDISTINELPGGRKNIVTMIVPPEKRTAAYEFIRKQVAEGRQAFVVCPRIEQAESENAGYSPYGDPKIELKSVKEEHKKLSEHIFPNLSVAMLHGQMPARGKNSKQEIMNEFRDNKINILVSTSVIEVGVDVPNATVMMIEGSDRFGLAQIYQFRGRVGRGKHRSYCFLFTDSSSRQTHARLKALLEAKNGFELAERDLAIRGPGQFLGTEQTGLPDAAMRGLQDLELIAASRQAAVDVLNTNANLKKYPALAVKTAEFRAKIHSE